ncbi:hypothetical protein V9T40_006425 [Parthenolecanium corni]|uniref:C2H2-type domain-containing protein n=1 Tax=Parthenolecanium corni TaxID=536013 RepID=A0AAN9Y6M5_9HEMI
MDHIRTTQALGNIRQMNSVCVPMVGTDVRMLCTYCIHSECGNNYDTFVSVMCHIRSDHRGVVSSSTSHGKENEVEVQVQLGERRPLTSYELLYMQMWSKLNLLAGEGADGDSLDSAAQTAPPPRPVRRRQVAIKSTARPTAHESERLSHLMSTSRRKRQVAIKSTARPTAHESERLSHLMSTSRRKRQVAIKSTARPTAHESERFSHLMSTSRRKRQVAIISTARPTAHDIERLKCDLIGDVAVTVDINYQPC